MDFEKAKAARERLEQEKKEREERLKQALEANERFLCDFIAKKQKI